MTSGSAPETLRVRTDSGEREPYRCLSSPRSSFESMKSHPCFSQQNEIVKPG